MYENRIKHLEEAHHMLDKKIDQMERTGIYGDEDIHDLKKKRLFLKDEIVLLQAKQAGLEE
jgi:hypothetical protein